MKVYGISSQIIRPCYHTGASYDKCSQSYPLIPPLCSDSKTIYPKIQKDSKIACAYMNAQAINFGYKSILKTYWLKGKMPTVLYDMGGNLLTEKNITLGHMLPHSKGGKSCLANYMLETLGYNMSKSNQPFSKFFNQEAFDKYCAQFETVELPDFSGKGYIEQITRTAERLVRQGK